MSADGTGARALVRGRGPYSAPCWSADGRRVAFIEQGSVMVVNADGTDRRRLMDADPGLAWSPEGRHATAGRRSGTWEARRQDPVPSPDGLHLVRSARLGIEVAEVDDGQGRRVARGEYPSWSPDGLRIAFVCGQCLCVVGADGAGWRGLKEGAMECQPEWSSDGSRLFFLGRPRTYPYDLCAINADGTGSRRLTGDAVGVEAFVLSPDGGQILFVGTRESDSGREIWAIGADGSGQRRLAGAEGSDCHDAAWSPDGRSIVFVRRALPKPGGGRRLPPPTEAPSPPRTPEEEAAEARFQWATEIASRAEDGDPIPDPQVVAVIGLLADPDPGVQAGAASCLASIARKEGAPSRLLKTASPRLLHIFEEGRRSSKPYLAEQAARALYEIGPGSNEAVPVLTEGLRDRNPGVRAASAMALTCYGDRAKPAVPLLAGGLRDRDAAVREACAWCLGEVGPGARDAIPDLIAALRDPSPEVRCRVSRAIGYLGSAARTAEAALRQALRDPDPSVSEAAGKALERLKEDRAIGTSLGATDVPALLNSLKDGDADVRRAAAVLLRDISPAPEVAVPAFAELLADPGLRTVAAQALGDYGPDAAAAAPRLEALLAGTRVFWEERQEIALALWRVGGRAEAVVPMLVGHVQRATGDELHHAAKILRELGPAAAPAVPALIEVLGDREWQERRQCAIEVLGRIGPAAEPAVPALVAMLRDTLQSTRVVRALRGIGSRAALPALIAASQDERVLDRWSAREAAKRIDPSVQLPLAW
ncbi:MAG: HEAT repeat domain-containing protein [Armatimonadetes bacterium]|nr:HEAT repeat domain-containing protein [Armatimonadota bacterium]